MFAFLNPEHSVQKILIFSLDYFSDCFFILCFIYKYALFTFHYFINIKAINLYFVFFKHNLDEEEDGKTPTQPLLKKGRHFSSFYFNPFFILVILYLQPYYFFYLSFYFHGEVMLQLFIKCRLEKSSLA